MYYFPLDSPQLLPFKSEIALYANDLEMNIELATKLLSISMANGHDYFGHTEDVYREVASLSFDQRHILETERCALFLYASKVSHSCHPNTSYTSKAQDGKMEYKAIRQIEEGDLITFSYIGSLWETPTHLRRKMLRDNARSFVTARVV